MSASTTTKQSTGMRKLLRQLEQLTQDADNQPVLILGFGSPSDEVLGPFAERMKGCYDERAEFSVQKINGVLSIHIDVYGRQKDDMEDDLVDIPGKGVVSMGRVAKWTHYGRLSYPASQAAAKGHKSLLLNLLATR